MQDEITQLLAAWSGGDQAAPGKLISLVYGELRRRARHYLRGESSGHTLQATALIHEAFLKFSSSPQRQWENRSHFLAVAAQAIRHILVDYSRSRQCGKRSGTIRKISLEESAVVSVERDVSAVTVTRDWRLAKAWLRRDISGESLHGS